MSRHTLSAALLATALLALAARAADPEPQLPEELRDTLPGGSRLGDAPDLPHASVDVLPKPTEIRIEVKRQAQPRGED
jgi:hypothetical protein